MNNFLIKELVTDDFLSELKSIDFDKSYAEQVVNKYNYKNIKIFGLNAAQANILKQTALSVGSDCATPRDTITGNVISADCILGGSISQLKKIAVKLGVQPFGLRQLGRQIEKLISVTMDKKHSVQIMGILNLTNNSFSDGGMYSDFDKAVEHLNKLISDGADMIDIGAESTKPYSESVSPKEQLDKILPVLDYIRNNNIEIPVSIDTRSSEVAKRCLNSGATAINDVSGLTYDTNMQSVIADYGCPVIIQHSKGTPDIMQNSPHYDNLMDEIYIDLSRKVSKAVAGGIKRENIIIDPGIGFGKTREHNFEILRRIEELQGLDCPVLLGLSRKSLLNMPDADNDTKDIFTVALNTLAIQRKVDIIRVHNVKLHKTLLEVLK